MQFPEIHSATDPEDYCWEVQLDKEQELRQVDDQHAAVYYTEGEHLAFEITAEPAHDAEGTTVPTTIAASEGNVITLTVHHREGNPAADGAPFVYPIVAGVGWEGGFHTYPAVIEGPPDESELRRISSAPSPESAAGVCLVPNLLGKSLPASRRTLQKRGCRLGSVRGKRSQSAHVARQYRRAGESLPAGTKVGVKLAG